MNTTENIESVSSFAAAMGVVADLPEGDGPTILAACLVASGKEPADPSAEAKKVKGAHKDYSARGSRREHWYRMVLRNGTWEYVSTERLAAGNFRASERHDTVYGEMFEGELAITHDHGAGVDATAHLLAGGKFIDCDVKKTRAGLKITLPDGSVVTAANPRK